MKTTPPYRVEFGKDAISIVDSSDPRLEVLYWDRQEWVEDPELVFAIAGAITLALGNPDGPGGFQEGLERAGVIVDETDDASVKMERRWDDEYETDA